MNHNHSNKLPKAHPESSVLDAVSLRNAIRKINPDLKIKIKNANDNGITYGCTGFITNMCSGEIVFVNTDIRENTMGFGFYRIAAHHQDRETGITHFSTLSQMAESIVDILK